MIYQTTARLRSSDELESAIFKEFDVLSGVEEILTATTVSVMDKGRYRHVRNAVAEMDRDVPFR